MAEKETCEVRSTGMRTFNEFIVYLREELDKEERLFLAVKEALATRGSQEHAKAMSNLEGIVKEIEGN